MTGPAAAIDRRRLAGDLARRLGSATEARWLLEAALAAAAPGDASAGEPGAALEAMVERRLSGEPLQYVLGGWAFRTLELACDPRALIPRPETEQVVEVALAELRRLVPGGRPARVVDLGTGTGAVALSLAVEGAVVEGAAVEVWATDADPGALALAAANRDRVEADHPGTAGRVTLCEGDWCGALPATLRGRVDLIVSNPPYVSEGEWPALDPEVRREPRRALVAAAGSDGTPGLADVEAVLADAWAWLARPGAAVVELAPHQAGAAQALATRRGFGDVEVRPDLAGRPRALVARVA
jgi:release factor glutamine methyltransferase